MHNSHLWLPLTACLVLTAACDDDPDDSTVVEAQSAAEVNTADEEAAVAEDLAGLVEGLPPGVAVLAELQGLLEEQSRLLAETAAAVAAGELSPEEADAAYVDWLAEAAEKRGITEAELERLLLERCGSRR
jgi:hypothetical protein